MQFLAIQRVVALLLMAFSLSMLTPLLVSWRFHDGVHAPYLHAFAITLAAGLLLWLPVVRVRQELRIRDGFAVIALFWIVLGLFGAFALFAAVAAVRRGATASPGAGSAAPPPLSARQRGFVRGLAQGRGGRALLVATLILGALIGAVCAVVGVYVVLRGMSFIGAGIAHARFGGVVPEIASSAKARSLADWKRCSGAFSRQRRTMRSSAGATARPDSPSSAGSSLRMAVMVSAEVPRWKARSPASISYRMAPNAKMSERWSATWPRTCSGDM